jgi:hypothetical protein
MTDNAASLSTDFSSHLVSNCSQSSADWVTTVVYTDVYGNNQREGGWTFLLYVCGIINQYEYQVIMD